VPDFFPLCLKRANVQEIEHLPYPIDGYFHGAFGYIENARISESFESSSRIIVSGVYESFVCEYPASSSILIHKTGNVRLSRYPQYRSESCKLPE